MGTSWKVFIKNQKMLPASPDPPRHLLPPGRGCAERRYHGGSDRRVPGALSAPAPCGERGRRAAFGFECCFFYIPPPYCHRGNYLNLHLGKLHFTQGDQADTSRRQGVQSPAPPPRSHILSPRSHCWQIWALKKSCEGLLCPGKPAGPGPAPPAPACRGVLPSQSRAAALRGFA